MKTPIRVAMIGFGLSGRYLQGPFFLRHPDFELSCIITRQDVVQVAGYEKVRSSASLDTIWSDASIDLVAICSPNDTHVALAQQALLAGKHVLVDKPLASSLAEVQALYDLAEKQNKVLAVFHNRRFDSDFRTIQEVIASGKLGRLVRVEMRYDRYKPELNPKKWKEETRSANGILYDLGSHLLDQMIYLFGKPARVWGATYQEREGTHIEDAFDIVASYDQGPSVFLHSSLLAKQPLPRYTLYGTLGSFQKFGIDPQEDHLKADRWPGDAGFGQEEEVYRGILSTEAEEAEWPTNVGNWGLLFDSLAAAIRGEAPFVVQRAQIEAQFEIISSLENRP